MKRNTLLVAVALCAGCTGATQTKSEDSVASRQTTKSDSSAAEPTPTEPQASAVAAFEKRCRGALDKAKAVLPEIVADKDQRTVANTLEPYNRLAVHLGNAAAVASLTSSVHPKESVRAAARDCEQDVEAFSSELALHRGLYEAFAAIDTEGLAADAVRLVENTLRDFRRAGVDKDEATRERIRAIDKELVELGQQFSKNIVDDVRSITVDGVEGLAGLPQDYIDAHQPGPDGTIEITTDYPDYIPFMSYADSAELRKELYIARRSRAGDANERVLSQILSLRDEKAELLGYDSWADYITGDKMIESAGNARTFLERIVNIAEPRARRDYEQLLKRKRADHPDAKVVQQYEKTYYENKVKAEKFDFDPQAVRAYFPYEKVEQGLLDTTARMYGLEYKRVTDADVWHEDVKVFDVFDGDGDGGDKLGRIYLDMHPRDGKYKHAAQFTLRPGVKGVQLPEGVLVCNFPNPRDKGGSALMEHDDVVTMFHEFGHLMHHILGGHQKWVDQSGVATEWDFVEAPSQMFEEWAWNHESLKTFAVHNETGEPISEDLVERMRAAHKFGIGVRTVQQMFYAAVSLNFHTADPDELDMLATVEKLQNQYTPFPFVDGTRFHSSFGHLEGYSALYYTYMWSLVIAKDLLTPFKEHGIMNGEWTTRYREQILAPGGTKDAADLVKQFLGREYDFKAFERYLTGSA